jgi:hypothetical protein
MHKLMHMPNLMRLHCILFSHFLSDQPMHLRRLDGARRAAQVHEVSGRNGRNGQRTTDALVRMAPEAHCKISSSQQERIFQVRYLKNGSRFDMAIKLAPLWLDQP